MPERDATATAHRGKSHSKKEDAKMPKRDVERRLREWERRLTLFMMLAAYANTLLASLFIGVGFIAQNVSVVENPADVSNSVSLLFYMLFATAVMLLVLRLYRGKLLFLILEFGFIFMCAVVAASAFLPGYELWAAALTLAIRLVFSQTQTVMLLGSAAVVGAILGASLDFLPAAVFAVLIAAYDYIAVFRTKHMVALAKAFTERGAAFSVKVRVNRSSMELGLGDFVVGTTVSVAALKIGAFPSLDYGIAAVLGATAGLAAMFWVLEKKGGYFPAVPPITAGSLLCVGAYWAVRTAIAG